MYAKRRVKSDTRSDEPSMSTAAAEAFEYLNAAVRQHYRGGGDTPTAARARAARETGITSAQADRIWNRWRTMGSVDGDVYRALRNWYEALCEKIEHQAALLERQNEENNAANQGHSAGVEGMVGSEAGKEGLRS